VSLRLREIETGAAKIGAAEDAKRISVDSWLRKPLCNVMALLPLAEVPLGSER